jgi:hypothetical protein
MINSLPLLQFIGIPHKCLITLVIYRALLDKNFVVVRVSLSKYQSADRSITE